jgi:DNA-binding transcriptional LysR family regulator
MDLELLAVFRQVARHDSFTAAADRLGYTQSAVSRQVSALEEEFGAVLFDRLPRGVRLTEEGRCLLPHAEAVAGQLAAARGDLRALHDLTAGRLRVGAFPTANAGLVPRAAAAFRAEHPAIALSLGEGLTGELAAQLRAGELDLAVVAPETDLDGLELRPLIDDPMLVAMHAGHPLSGRRSIRLAELAGDDWIAGSERPEETLIGAAARAGFRPAIRYVIGEWIAKQGLVAAGLGITLMPALAARAVRPDIIVVRLHPDDSWSRSVYLATAAGITPAAATAAFASRLLAEAASDVPDPLFSPAPPG